MALSMPHTDQAEYATKCGTTIGYLRKGLSTNQKFSSDLALRLEKESDKKVTVEELRPDLNEQWAYMRGTKHACC